MDCKIIEIPKISNVKGNLAVIERETIPFEIKRVFYLYDIVSQSQRKGHALKNTHQLIIAISGSFSVKIINNNGEQAFILNKPTQALLLPANTWREIYNFSSGSVCLVLASEKYNENEYIRDLNEL